VKDDRRAIIDPTTDLNITLSFCHTNFLPLYHYKILLEQHGYSAIILSLYKLYSAIILALYMSYSLDTTRRGCLVSKREKFKLLRDK
jgi:hypothetical protein